MTQLGIVIVNWNTCDYLRRCLASVYASRGLSSFEVVVVDNASSDDSVKMVRAEFPQATLIANHDNMGYPAANNQGLRDFGSTAWSDLRGVRRPIRGHGGSPAALP